MKTLSTLILFLSFIFITNTVVYAAKGPKIVSPLNKTVLNTAEVRLSWEAYSKENVTYEIMISESKGFNPEESLCLKTKANYISIKYPYFEAGKEYYWTIKAVYPKSNGVFSNTEWSHERNKNAIPFSFLIASEIKNTLKQPNLISPGSEAKLDTLQPCIKWQFYNLAKESYTIQTKSKQFILPTYKDISYDIQISQSSDFGSDTRTFSPISADSLQIALPILFADSKYFCRVRAHYFDPILQSKLTTSWSDSATDAYTFSTSENARGTYHFSEGSPLENIKKKYHNYSLELLVNNEHNNFNPSVSMNGQMLSFISDRTGKKELYLKPLEERREGGETQKTNIMAKRSIHNPFWLFDDERVGFFANLYNPKSWHIFSSNQGSGLTIMTSGMEMAESNSEFSLSGSCSTDGRVIFAAKMYDSDPYMMYMLDLSDDSRTQLRQGLFPDIRDDDKVVFCSNETGNYEIWVVDLEGKSVFRPTILNSHPADDFEPAFSPGGDKILFTSTRNGNSDIWLMNADGSNCQQLTDHPMVDRHPQWIDNNKIVFQSNRTKNKKEEHIYSIYLLRLDL